MPEMPLMPALAGEEGVTPEEMPAAEAAEPGPVEDAKKAVEAAEMYAVDCETIAEKVPEAKDAAKKARDAADEVVKLAAAAEEAQANFEKVDPADAEARAAAKAVLDEAMAPVLEQLAIAKEACEEAKGYLPMVESDESDLAEWASAKVGGGY